ncbi:MAG: type II secretion system protein GspG [Candidatus Hinthialibacter antarcticus]|nr:type II secretion system protein GspG [Candidatus Hinthialibacter antarcticus]
MTLGSLVAKFAVIGAVGYMATASAEDFIGGLTQSTGVVVARADMKSFHQKFSEFYTTNGRYPTPPQELHFFIKEEYDTPPEETIKDPWGAEYLFLGPEVEIRCLGADQKLFSNDDLTTPYPPNRNPPVLIQPRRR